MNRQMPRYILINGWASSIGVVWRLSQYCLMLGISFCFSRWRLQPIKIKRCNSFSCSLSYNLSIFVDCLENWTTWWRVGAFPQPRRASAAWPSPGSRPLWSSSTAAWPHPGWQEGKGDNTRWREGNTASNSLSDSLWDFHKFLAKAESRVWL